MQSNPITKAQVEFLAFLSAQNINSHNVILQFDDGSHHNLHDVLKSSAKTITLDDFARIKAMLENDASLLLPGEPDTDGKKNVRLKAINQALRKVIPHVFAKPPVLNSGSSLFKSTESKEDLKLSTALNPK